jgi:hypothetical protein
MNALSMANRQLNPRRSIFRLPNLPGLSGALAGLSGGVAMTIVAALLTGALDQDVWLQTKVIASLVLGPSVGTQAGFVAGAVLLGLVIHLGVAALLGALFELIMRRIGRLPTDFGVPELTGLAYGLVIWLAAFFVIVPFVAPALLAIYMPAFIIEHIVFGAVTGLVYAILRPKPYVSLT